MTANRQIHPSAEAGQAEKPSINCPILAGLSRIADLTQDLQHTMSQLRRDLDHCKTCPARQACPVMQEYQQQISQAIDDFLAEFHLS
jgi:hypothetical protein